MVLHDPCLPIVDVVDTVRGPCTDWCTGVVGLVQRPGYPGKDGLFEMEFRGVEQDLISYVGKLELANVPVEGWIIGHYNHNFLDCPSSGM